MSACASMPLANNVSHPSQATDNAELSLALATFHALTSSHSKQMRGTQLFLDSFQRLPLTWTSSFESIPATRHSILL